VVENSLVLVDQQLERPRIARLGPADVIELG
jgi:hypothetical protein